MQRFINAKGNIKHIGGVSMLKHIKEVKKDSRKPNTHWERYEWNLKSGAKVEFVREITKLDSDEYY